MFFFSFKRIFAGLIICLLMVNSASANRYSQSPIIVTVNGTKIREVQVDKVLQKYLRTAMSIGQKPNYAMRHNMTLRAIDELIEKVVLGERIRAKGIEVTVKEVNDKIAEIAEMNNISVQAFYNKAYSTQSATPTDVKDQIAMGLRFDKLMVKEAGPKYFQVSDREAERYYDRNKDQFTEPRQVRASHIMIKYPGDDKSGKKEVKFAMGKISEMAKRGVDFGKLARKYSQDDKSRKKGGDLGFFTRKNMMPEEIAKAAFSLKPGEVSGVIEMLYGCHVIKVTQIDPGGLVGFDKVKDEIKTLIVDEMKAEYAKKYIQRHLAGAKIEWAGGKRPEPMPVEQPGNDEADRFNY